MSEQPQAPALDGLIVDLDQLSLVSANLDGMGVTASATEPDEGLGLVLLSGLLDGAARPVTEVDALLAELRRQFAARFGGWVPELGKNRAVDAIIRSGTSKPMADAGPAPVETPAALGTRAEPEAGQGVRVGILDTPLYLHPGFDPDHVHATPVFVPSAEPVPPHAGHGTFVAGLVLAQAPAAQLDVHGVLDSATGRGSLWETARHMVALGNSGVDVLNLSFGTYTVDGAPPLVLRRALERMSPDVVVVAAAGNQGDLLGWERDRNRVSPTYPAALPPVVAVGATDASGNPATFSPQLPWVTCTALGVGVEGAYLDGTVLVYSTTSDRVEPTAFHGHATWSGTSFAAATVSGAIAARTVPDKVTARQALADLLADPAGDPESVVRKYHYQP